MTVFNAEEVKKCLEDVVGKDKEYALWLLEWAINKRSFDLEEYRKQIRADAIDEFRNRLFGKLVRLTLSMWHFKLFDDVLQETYNELKEQNK